MPKSNKQTLTVHDSDDPAALASSLNLSEEDKDRVENFLENHWDDIVVVGTAVALTIVVAATAVTMVKVVANHKKKK